MTEQKWTKAPEWISAPDWATFLYRDVYGVWTWADDFPRPNKTLPVSDRLFEQPTLTNYDVALTLQSRPLGE